MRILIIDDEDINHLSAKQTLAGHELIHASTYYEATKALEFKVDPLPIARDLVSKYRRPDEITPRAIEVEMEELPSREWNRLAAKHDPAPFDVVFTDLLMPPGFRACGSQRTKFEGLLLPVGLLIVLFAAKQPDVKRIVVVTSSNHHSDPMTSALEDDQLNEFVINQTNVRIVTKAERIPVAGTRCTRKAPDGRECPYCYDKGIELGKNWRAYLPTVL